MGKFTRDSLTGETGKLFPSQVLLVGNGILARKIYLYLRAKGVNCNKVTSSIILNRKNWEKKKPDSNSKSLTSNDYRLVIAAEDFPNIRLFEIINKLLHNKNQTQCCFTKIVSSLFPILTDKITNIQFKITNEETK